MWLWLFGAPRVAAGSLPTRFPRGAARARTPPSPEGVAYERWPREGLPRKGRGAVGARGVVVFECLWRVCRSSTWPHGDQHSTLHGPWGVLWMPMCCGLSFRLQSSNRLNLNQVLPPPSAGMWRGRRLEVCEKAEQYCARRARGEERPV